MEAKICPKCKGSDFVRRGYVLLEEAGELKSDGVMLVRASMPIMSTYGEVGEVTTECAECHHPVGGL